MPPGNVNSAPDVLDKALAVARSQKPATVPGQQGFFQALKPNSNQFAQTTRINVARPAAQQAQQALVVPPPQKPAGPTPAQIAAEKARVVAEISAHMPHSSSVAGLAGDVKKGYLAAQNAVPYGNYKPGAAALSGANNLANRAVKAADEGQTGPHLQGAASLNENFLQQFQGVPLASISQATQQKIKDAYGFFAKNPQYHYNVPNIGIFGAKDKTALGLAPTATDGDVIRKYGDQLGNFGHRSYFGDVIHNLVKGPVELAAAPVGIAYATANALAGNGAAEKELVRQQFQFGKSLIPGVGDPLGAFRGDPIGTATGYAALLRLAGGAGGTVARTGALGDTPKAFATPAPRSVVPNLGVKPMTPEGVELQPHAINRGMTSTKLDERAAQAISDKLASGTQFFGRRLQQHQSDAITKAAIQKRDALEREHAEPAIRAAAKLSPTEERATRFIHGQGLGTPKEHAAFMQQQADAHRATTPEPGKEARWQQEQRSLDADAKLWNKVASNRKVGDTLTKDQQDYLDKATHASRFAEQDLASMSRKGTNVPLVSPDTALRSGYAPSASVRALRGDQAAAQMVGTTGELNRLHGEIQKAPDNPLPTAATREIDRIQRETANDLDKQLNQAKRRLAQAQTLKRKVSPGQKPTLKGTPGQITQLEKRVGAIADAKARADAGDYTNARIKQLQGRAVPTKTQLGDERTQIGIEQDAALHALRSAHRERVGAPAVEPGAPLDQYDPLYNPHAFESPKAMKGLRGGNGLPMMHGDPAARFGDHRLGTPGHMRTGSMIPAGQATSAPHVFFGAVAKPLRVAAALEHFRQQGATWIRDVPADTAYDPRNWVRVRDDHTGAPNSDVHTMIDTHEATRHADDAQTLRQQILGGVQDEKGNVAHIPADGGTYHLAPRQSINNLENRLKGIDHGTLARIAKTGTGLWRWTTLMARPAWLVNNIAGNFVQASIAGAGPQDWVDAFKQGAGGHPVEGVENAGQFKNIMQQKPTLGNRALKPVHAFTNTVVGANVRFENLARRAVANHALNKLAKAHVHGEIGTIRSSFHHTSQAVRDAMENPTPEMQARAVMETDRALGNFIRTKTSTGLDLIAPFHRWFEFIAKYTATMPIRTPGRALLIQRLGNIGINVQNQQLGGFQPNGKIGSLQIPSGIPFFGGQFKSTQGLNPLASAFQLVDPTDQSTTNPNAPQAGGLVGATNPLLVAALNWATGKDNSYSADNNSILDKYGNPVGGFNTGVLKDQLLGTLPIASAIQGFKPAVGQPRTGPADRIGGYLFGGVGPFDPLANQYAKAKKLKTAEIAKARNKLKNG